MMLLICKLHSYEHRQQKKIAKRCSTVICYIPRQFSNISVYSINPVFRAIEDMGSIK